MGRKVSKTGSTIEEPDPKGEAIFDDEAMLEGHSVNYKNETNAYLNRRGTRDNPL